MISPQVVPTASVRALGTGPAERAAKPVRVTPAPVASAHAVPRQVAVEDAPRRITLAQAQAALRVLDRAS